MPAVALPSMQMKTLQVAAAALVNARGEVLLSQRRRGDPLSGMWEFPGGKCEDGEGALEALHRELAEELDISVRGELTFLDVNLHRYDKSEVTLSIWICREWNGTPHGLEGQRLHWAPVRCLASWPMPAADRPAATALSVWFSAPDTGACP